MSMMNRIFYYIILANVDPDSVFYSNPDNISVKYSSVKSNYRAFQK